MKELMTIKAETKRAVGALVLLIIIAIGLMFLIDYDTPFLRSDIPNLQEQGKTIIEQIEEFKATEGKYPDSISDINMPAHSFRFGEWSYRPTSNAYCIGIGNYSKNSFDLSYTPDGGWYLNQ